MKGTIITAAVMALSFIMPAASAQAAQKSSSNIAALLDEAPPPARSLEGVVLASTSGDVRLQPLPGSFSTTYAFVTVLMFMDYPGQHATVRTRDPRPTIHLKIGMNPKGRVYLVKAESNEDTDNRSVKMGRSGFGSIGSMTAPDAEWVIPCAVTQDSAGIWKLVPDAPLAPGEYGVFTPNLTGGAQVPASGELYDFGVDAS